MNQYGGGGFGGYGGPPQGGGYGPPQGGGYGPPQGQYGGQPQQGYGPPQGGGYGQPQGGGGGWYDRIQQAKVGGGGAKFLPGNYILVVEDVKEHKGGNNPAFPDVFFIVETKVLQSDNPQLPVGMAASQVIKLNGPFPETALGDVKAFCAAVMGLDPRDPRADQEITPPVIAGILRRPCPVRGHVLGANVWMKNPGPKSKPGTQPFAKIAWMPRLVNGQPERQNLAPLQDQPPGQQAPQQGYGAPQQGYGAPPPQQAPQQGPPPGQGYGAPQGQGWAPPGNPGQAPNQGTPVAQGQPGPGAWAPPGQGAWGTPSWGGGQPQAQTQQAPQYQPQGYAPQGGPPPVAGFGAPQGAPPAPAFPPPGWTAHPQAPGHYHNGRDVLTEAQLRALMATGKA